MIAKIKKVAKKIFKHRKDYISNYHYSVVSTVYSLEGHIDNFFNSLVKQSLNFQEYIQVIIVDVSNQPIVENKIKEWQRLFPENIIYLKKSSQDKRSAKQIGVTYATGDWVTFIDPEDFVDRKYFKKVDKLIGNHENISLVLCRCIYFREDLNVYKKNHPLRSIFSRDNYVVSAQEPGKLVHNISSNVFLKLNFLKASNLNLGDFNDGPFLSQYHLMHQNTMIGIVSSAKYYYRQRKDSKTSYNKEINELNIYNEQMVGHYLCLFRSIKSKDGYIPLWLQRTVFFDMAWRIRYAIRHSSDLGIRAIEQKYYFSKVQELISFIDDETITAFELGGINHLLKSGIQGLFKGKQGLYSHVKIIAIDTKRKLLKLKYTFYGKQLREKFYFDNEEIQPTYSKNVAYDLCGLNFATQRIVWLPFNNISLDANLRVYIDDAEAVIISEDRKVHNLYEITVMFKSTIQKRIPLKHLLIRLLARTWVVRRVYSNAWLLMDRDTHADDNAEHLYRYIKNNYFDIKAFFILKKSSHDYQRLKQDGFKIINFGSIMHRLALLNARHMITSHITYYAVDYLPKKYYRDMLSCDNTFLQHGVIVHDMSARINKNVDLFLTSSKREYDSIVSNKSSYEFCEKEVVLTGLPRHDALLEDSTDKSKMLLIMPTWRRALIGGGTKRSSERRFFNTELRNTRYFQEWRRLLNSEGLKGIVDDHNIEVVFFPHAYLGQYLDLFDAPPYIEVLHHNDSRIQQLFKRASCMITDYSSVAFEMAYLQKPVLYYQFDRDFFFSEGHSFKKGYFDYYRDGFGPVCHDQKSLILEIDNMLKQNCQPDSTYFKRMNSFFAYRDGRCCERVVKAILSLEKGTQ